MAKTDKDNAFKADALRYCLATGAVPFLEVIVESGVDLTAKPRVLTDIDVMGLRLFADGSIQRTLIDCKSSGPPPVSRVFWLAGLMHFVEAHEGYILLGRPAERAHRLAARQLEVRLFDAKTFADYAQATNSNYELLKSYAGDLAAWHLLSEQSSKAKGLDALYSHLTSTVPLSKDAPRSVRQLIAVLKEHRGEMNPSKPLHMALFTEAVLAMSILLVAVMGDLRHIVDLGDEVEQYTSTLRYYLWGGRDGVANLKRMHDLGGGAETIAETEALLVAWPQLIQLTRGLLEAPTAVRNCCLPLRELVLRFVCAREPQAEARLGELLSAPRARQFTKRIASYTAAAARLPNEFVVQLEGEIDALVAGSIGTTASA